MKSQGLRRRNILGNRPLFTMTTAAKKGTEILYTVGYYNESL